MISSTHSKKIEIIFKELKTSRLGLSTKEAKKRLQRLGENELKDNHHLSALKVFLNQFASPLIWILLIALIISSILGEITNSLIIFAIVMINTILGFVQEFRAEKTISSLKKISAHEAKVLRDGKITRIMSRHLVPGDVILLEVGDKVPADARLIETSELRTQEASLTGESQPTKKFLGVLRENTVLAEKSNMVFGSTIVITGKGTAVVTSTGMRTEIGKIAHLIEKTPEKHTPLQHNLSKLSRYLSLIVLFIAVIIFVVGITSGKDPAMMFLTAIAVAVAAIPEGLPAVITISLSLAIQRMSQKNSLIRKLTSVETLGSVNVICTDKTGTLTMNEMTVTKIFTNSQTYELSGIGYDKNGKITLDKKLANPETLQLILKTGALCNSAKIEKGKVIGDPTEAALLISAEKAGLNIRQLHLQEPRTAEIPFTSERKMMTTIHKNISYTKGNPELILDRCNRLYLNNKIIPLDKKTKLALLKENEQLAKQALRVLAFAYNQKFSKKEDSEQDMVFLGFQAMIDPPREEAKKAIKRCQDAGIRVIMITGDQLHTAKAIAEKLNISGKAVTGSELKKIDLKKEINSISVFARIDPEQKLHIVNALKNSGHIVAMTGDGINDAPALKKADIGIAMGLTGTDVAKESSEMILIDDNFSSIVSAVEEGRGIFNNIRKFINYLLSTNLGEVCIIFFASLFGLPLPLTALQILWINLISDGLPATALSLDPYSPNNMKNPPRHAQESILTKRLWLDIIFFGILAGAAVIVLFWLSLDQGLPKAQTIAFTSIFLFEIIHLYSIRKDHHLQIFSNIWLLGSILISILLMIIIIYTPLSVFFGTSSLSLKDWGMIIISGTVLFVIYRSIIFLIRKIYHHFKKEALA
jgi:Ca2+-transporting ATPase